MIKLILSYVPVQLTYSRSSSHMSVIVAVDKVRWKGVCSWGCPGLLPGVRYRQHAFCTECRGTNVVHECRVSWSMGYVSCTGKYDNISFIIKTPYYHTYLRISYNIPPSSPLSHAFTQPGLCK